MKYLNDPNTYPDDELHDHQLQAFAEAFLLTLLFLQLHQLAQLSSACFLFY